MRAGPNPGLIRGMSETRGFSASLVLTLGYELLKFWHLGRKTSSSLLRAPLTAVSGMASEQSLSRRERQMMDVLFQAGEATAAEVQQRLVDPPSNTAVRTMLRILEDKGLVEHRAEG